MSQRNVRTCLLLARLLTGAILVPCTAAAAQESCVTAKCHATVLKPQNTHAVVEPCDGCHEAVTTPHPKKGAKTFKLTQEPPDLCTTCHESFGSKKHVHAPVEAGTCTVCHNPHASNEPKLLAEPLKDLCKTCHADHVDLKVAHGPVAAGDCTACHTPHESDVKSLLLKDEPELCFGCHLDMPDVLKKQHVHAPVEGSCTSCHNPHGGAHPKLLNEEGPEVCYLCHNDIGEKVNDSPVVHAAVLTGCPSCHSPHASDNPKLLLEPQKDTCLGCHDGVLTKTMTVFHGPINNGECSACHDPHGNKYERLLSTEYTADTYVPYTGKEFAFCFSCHKRELLQYPQTSFATNFRDGERNLHYLHVNNKQKGRGCRLCHVIHGSSSPKLIAESVPFGKWNLPVRFVKTDTGGGCSPGCHTPQYYDRKSPGKKPGVKKPEKEGE